MPPAPHAEVLEARAPGPPVLDTRRKRHFFLVGWMKVSSAPVLRFSARFSLMDLPDFLDMLWRGDLSLMGISEREHEWLHVSTVRLVGAAFPPRNHWVG